MDGKSQWVCMLAFLPSGFIYVYTMQRRVERRKQAAAGILLFFLLCIWMSRIPFENIPEAAALLKLFGFCMLAWLLHAGIRLTWTAAVYYGIWAFLTWQILSELWLISISLPVSFLAGFPLPEWAAGILIYLTGYTLAALSIGKFMPDGGEKKIGPRQLGLAALNFLSIQILAVMFETTKVDPYDLRWLILYMTQLLLAVALYLQNELFKKSDMRREMELMNFLWKKEQEQYRLSKETIALINQKAHDLKHQIRALRTMPKEESARYLDEMEESVSIYEALVKTGNETLDIILTETSLYCREQGVALSCVADGSLLGFMDTVDLYALLGNAFDNAIEAVLELEDPQKRQIDLMIYRRQKFLAIQIINPTKNSPVYEDGFPTTTKEDRGYHGFGIKSMEHCLKKYGGVLSIGNEDGCFSLIMLIPLIEQKSSST